MSTSNSDDGCLVLAFIVFVLMSSCHQCSKIDDVGRDVRAIDCPDCVCECEDTND